jgi:hypothetical protein
MLMMCDAEQALPATEVPILRRDFSMIFIPCLPRNQTSDSLGKSFS